MVLLENKIITILYICAGVLSVISFLWSLKIRRKNTDNEVSRLIDSVRFENDIKSKTLFRKGIRFTVGKTFLETSKKAPSIRDLKKASRIFIKVASKAKEIGDKSYAMGWAGRTLHQLGDLRFAAKCYITAVKIAESDTFVLEQLGDFFYIGVNELGDEKSFEDAVFCYKELLKYNPNCSRTYYKLAKLYSGKKESECAYEQYKKAIETNNGYVAPMADIAIEYAMNGDKTNALKYYLLALANDVFEYEKLEEAIESCLQNN